MTYRIKPLVWETNKHGHCLDDDYCCYESPDRDCPGEPWIAYSDVYLDFPTQRFTTLEAAKSACEAHRLARLMEHLEPVEEK